MHRRKFLRLGIAGSVIVGGAPWRAFAAAGERPLFVWVILRGAMDSLHAVVPAGDAALERVRAPFLEAIHDGLLPLGDGFGLHPALANLHRWYQEGSFAPVLAVATPYRARSHFEAQDVLEGGRMPVDHDDGWLGRALREHAGGGIAIARSLPVSLRGADDARTWFPDALNAADEDLLRRLESLYADDPALRARLAEGMAMRARGGAQAPRHLQFADLATSCGELLQQTPDAACAVLEMDGWDTHHSQLRRLELQFRQLDAGLAALRVALGTAWRRTLVAVGTEFGRTVAMNGTGGTDHGTASTLLLAGGALRGGRLLGDWPGLAPGALFEGRDLMPTGDLRSWIGAALGAHWQLDAARRARIFPGAAPVAVPLLR